MKIRDAYEVIFYPQEEPGYSLGFFWTKDEADMAAESPAHSVKKVRVVWDGTAWYKVGELTHLNEPVKSLSERAGELKAGSYVAVSTNGHLDIICKITKRNDGSKIRTVIMNGNSTLVFHADTLTASKYGNVYKIEGIDTLPPDIVRNIVSTHPGPERYRYIEQALAFYEERIGA